MTDPTVKIAIVSPTFPPAICGVGAHTAKLVRELARLQPYWQWFVYTSPGADPNLVSDFTPLSNITVKAEIETWQGQPFLTQLNRLIQEDKPQIVLVQYTPHLYHRLGINPDLCTAVETLAQSGRDVHLLAHELYVPMDWYPRHWVTGPIQRWMMRRLVAACKGVYLSTHLRRQTLQKSLPRWKEKMHDLPVTSNIDTTPWTDADRLALKAQYCTRPDEKLLLFWGKLHSSKLLPLILTTLSRMQSRHIPFQAVYIGPDTSTLEKSLDEDFLKLKPQVHLTGSLPEAQVSQYLQTTDLLLYPLDDGASTRRGALMAALQHGTPVVTTLGPSTDELMRHCPGSHFAPSPHAFVDLACHLAQSDAAQITEASQAMQAYFNAHYTWTHIAQALLTHVAPLTPADRLPV